MCIAIACRYGATPPREHLEESCRQNPDGFGWAVITGSTVHTYKTMSATDAIDTFIAMRETSKQPALFHARIATAGNVDTARCHPFRVRGHGKHTALIHNGILPISLQPAKGDPRSDTQILAEDEIPSYTGGLASLKFRSAWETFLGWNKVCVLAAGKRAVADMGTDLLILNEHDGQWIDDVWYSNASYQRRTYSATSSYGYKWDVALGWAGTGASNDYTHVRCDWCNDLCKLALLTAVEVAQGENDLVCTACLAGNGISADEIAELALSDNDHSGTLCFDCGVYVPWEQVETDAADYLCLTCLEDREWRYIMEQEDKGREGMNV